MSIRKIYKDDYGNLLTITLDRRWRTLTIQNNSYWIRHHMSKDIYSKMGGIWLTRQGFIKNMLYMKKDLGQLQKPYTLLSS